MRMTLLLHILAGGLGLVSGYVALSATKGAPLHRKSGMLFVYVMLTLSVTGMLIAAGKGVAPALNIPLALLTFYLVITGLITVHRPAAWSRRLDVAAMVLGSGIGLSSFALAFVAIANGGPGAGIGFILIPFAGVALAASAGDRRMIRAGGVRGVSRLARHLWRMCFALFIASIAFYLGQGRVPEAIRTPALLAAGVLLPIVAMFYWLWRLRIRQSMRGVVGVSAPQSTAIAAVSR